VSARSKVALLAAGLVLCCAWEACASANGVASWYGHEHDGRLTASGCRFRASQLSAASPRLPLGTWVSVRNRRNHRVIRLQITDRAPNRHGRILDLSHAAAVRLGIVKPGLGIVEVRVLTAAHPIRCH